VPQLLVVQLPYPIDTEGRPDDGWYWQAVQKVDWAAVARAAMR
jgi:hypothetical protein